MKDTGVTWVVITFTKPEHSTPTLSDMLLQKQRESSQSYLLSLWDFSADPSALRETVGSWVLKRKSMKPPRRHGYRRSRLEGGCGIYHDDILNKQASLAGIGTSLNIEAGQYKLDWLLSWQDNFFPKRMPYCSNIWPLSMEFWGLVTLVLSQNKNSSGGGGAS